MPKVGGPLAHMAHTVPLPLMMPEICMILLSCCGGGGGGGTNNNRHSPLPSQIIRNYQHLCKCHNIVYSIS